MRSFVIASIALVKLTALNHAQTPPAQGPPGQTQTGQVQPGQTQPGLTQPGQAPGQGANVNPGTTPGTPGGDASAGVQIRAVDGVYVILAFERFGTPLGTGANRTVTIRNNVMTINTGDASAPTKSFILRFLPRNMIRMIEIDPRTGGDGIVNPVPRGTGATDAARAVAGVNQQGNANPINNTLGTEHGVYVLSNEFFAISIFARTTGSNPGVTPPGVTPPGVTPPGVTPNPDPPVSIPPGEFPGAITPVPKQAGQAPPSIGGTGTPTKPIVPAPKGPGGRGAAARGPVSPGSASTVTGAPGTAPAVNPAATTQPGNAGQGTGAPGTSPAQIDPTVGMPGAGGTNGAGVEQKLAVLILRRVG